MGDSTELRKSSCCFLKTDTHATDPMLFGNLAQESEDINLYGLKKEIGMDYLMSTEVLGDSDEPMLYSLGAEANTLLESLSFFDNNFDYIDGEIGERVSCNRSQSEVCKPLPSVASSWYEDGLENPSMVGAGLANLGNTCFFNAVLQCFTHSVLLVQGLYSNTHPTPCDYFSSSFQRYQQEDAHEFLQCFLDRLETSLSSLISTNDGLSSQTNNLVKQVFGGQFISKLRCCNCNHISDTFEPFVDLSLEIEDVNSLSKALESFTKVEHIEDEEMMFTCDKCKQKVFFEKQLLLDQIPPSCTFYLKRFKNDGSYVEKVEKHVEFDLVLDLQPYTCDNQSSNADLKYELYAVVVHAALTSSCGHYYSYIRSAHDTWYKFDDSRVTSVSEACVLAEEAYILFYAKQGTPWFSNFMETYSFNPNLSTTSPKSVLENADPQNIHSHSTIISDYVAPLPLIFKEYGSNHIIEAQKKVVFAAKPKQLKLAEKAACKRQRNVEVENSAKLEAMRMCKKMPGARGGLLMAAMSSKSENLLVKT
ncbi:hypothetical protein R6Q57_007330 [Mikania cordata]